MAREARLGTGGNWELWDSGQRISTGTEAYIKGQVAPEPAPAPVPAPTINRTVDPVDDPAVKAAEAHLNKFTAPQSYEEILETRRKSVQGLIDSANKVYDDEVASIKERGQERLSEQGAINVVSGLMGSPRAFAKRDKVAVATDKEVQAKNAERTKYLAEIYFSLEKDAREEARYQAEQARKDAEGILTRDKDKQAKAVENLKLIASSGMVEYDTFKSNPQNREVFDYALRTVGGSEEALKGIFALNRPQETVVERKWEGNYLFQVYEHPITGETRVETVNLADLGYSVPRGYNKSFDLGDQIMLVPDNFDPQTDTPFYISKSADPAEALKLETMRLQNDKLRKEIDQIGQPTPTEKKAEEENKAKAETAKKRADDVLTLITDLEKDSGLKDSVIGYRGLRGMLGTPGAADYINKVNRLKSLLAIDAIKDFKGLGPMSEREFGTAAAAASTITIDSDKGKITGTPEAFNDELERIRESMQMISTGDLTGPIYVPGDIVEVDGKRYKVGADGEELIPQ